MEWVSRGLNWHIGLCLLKKSWRILRQFKQCASSMIGVLKPITSLGMQLVAFFGNNNMEHEAMICWMETEAEFYIGRCTMTRSNRSWGAWLVYRWKELIKLYGSHLLGTHFGITRPPLIPIFSHRCTFASLEAASIGPFLPPTNNLEKIFGLQTWSQNMNVILNGDHRRIKKDQYPPQSSTPALINTHGSSFSMVTSSSLARPDQTWGSNGMYWAYLAWLPYLDHQKSLASQWATWSVSMQWFTGHQLHFYV